MPNSQFPMAGRGLAQGFRQGFNLTDKVLTRRQEVRQGRQELALERQQAMRKQLDSIAERARGAKEDLLSQAQTIVENSENPEQAMEAVQPLRRAYKGVAMQEAQLGRNIISMGQSLGQEPPEDVPSPAGKVKTEMQVFDSIVNNTMSGQQKELEGLQVGKDDLQIMTNLADGFAEGSLSPEEEQQFMSAVTNFRQPEQIRDPDTGLLVTRRNELPPFVENALQTRDVNIGGRQGGEGQQATKQQGGQRGQPGSVSDAQGEGGFSIGPQIAGPEEQPETTIGEEALKGNLVGPVPVLKRSLSRVPGMGGLAEEEVSAKSAFQTAKRQLVTSLQQSPRFAQSERQAIEKALDINVGAIDTPQRFFESLVGVDQTLQQQLQSLRSKVGEEAGEVSAQERQRAMDMIQRIEEFRRVSMPPVFSEQDTEELSSFLEQADPGTRFIFDPDDGDPQIRSLR